MIFVIDHHEYNSKNLSHCINPINGIIKTTQKCVVVRAEIDQDQLLYRQLVSEISNRIPALLIYDATPLFCNESECSPFDNNGKLLFGDMDHLNVFGAEILADDFIAWMRKKKIYNK